MLKCRMLPKGEGVELKGAIDSTTVSQLEKVLERYVNGNIKLDLSGVTELDDAGMRPILLASRRLKRSGGNLVLVGAPPAVRDFLFREGYHHVLTIY